MGDLAFNRMEKVNADLLVLTYGSLVTQLLKDVEDVEAVNAQPLAAAKTKYEDMKKMKKG